MLSIYPERKAIFEGLKGKESSQANDSAYHNGSVDVQSPINVKTSTSER